MEGVLVVTTQLFYYTLSNNRIKDLHKYSDIIGCFNIVIIQIGSNVTCKYDTSTMLHNMQKLHEHICYQYPGKQVSGFYIIYIFYSFFLIIIKLWFLTDWTT